MLVAFAVVALLGTVVAARGSLARLADVRLRRPWIVFVVLGVQVVITTVVPGVLPGVLERVHLATYALLGWFAWENRRLPGVPLIALGGAGNAAAITANGGVMPASPAALATAGMPADKDGAFANSAVVDGGHLHWLGDVFAVPASWPLSNVFSVGDVLIVVGFAAAVHVLGGSRLARPLGVLSGGGRARAAAGARRP